MKIRKLTNKDVLDIVAILSEKIPVVLENIENLKNEKDGLKFVIDIILSLVNEAREGNSEALKLLASLANMTEEELLNASPVTLLKIANAVVKDEDVKDFFTELKEFLSAALDLRATLGR